MENLWQDLTHFFHSFSMMEKIKKGQIGEKIAKKYLQKKGYQILGQNYLSRFFSGPQKGEIDIIAQKEDKIFFFEVKSQFDPKTDLFLPETKINRKKVKKLIKTAQEWLQKNGFLKEQKWQIDILSIKIYSKQKKAKIRHFKNVIFQ